ncbi:MAG: PEP-CTERM sorting domain-containing protein [Anaerolineae bacterium]|nr:PEP-CTERM sorting domain-containing protein [Anaerolineae bacterium]
MVDYPSKVSGYMSDDPFLTLNWSYEYIGPDAAYTYPIPEPGTLALFALGIAAIGFARRPDLPALLHEQHTGIIAFAVDEVPKALQRLRVLDRLLPFAFVAGDHA